MERREEHAPHERRARVIGLRVTDPAGLTLGVVVGRIITGTTIDLLSAVAACSTGRGTCACRAGPSS